MSNIKSNKRELSSKQREELFRNVFVYHNSAPSYYAVRAFRGSLRV
jgi:hypothetical protein